MRCFLGAAFVLVRWRTEIRGLKSVLERRTREQRHETPCSEMKALKTSLRGQFSPE